MRDTEQNKLSGDNSPVKKNLMRGNGPLFVGAAVLVAGSFFVGYTVGHRQGLTVVGFDADAEQLVEVVQQQRSSLEQSNKNLNTASQERDIAVKNADELSKQLTQAQNDRTQMQGLSTIYREILRQRGGVGLTIQNLGIKPLPENAYEYQLDLVQVSPNKRRTAGSAEIRLIRGEEVLVVPLENRNFNFDEFARLTGRWTMPRGFVPQYVEVRLNSNTSPVIKRFSWQRGNQVEVESAFGADIPQATANSN